MFRGRYEHNIDAKGRLALPSAFKKELEKLGDARSDERPGSSPIKASKPPEVAALEAPLVVTTHISSPCLVAYPLGEWQRFEERLAKLPQFEPSVMTLRRLYVGGAIECAIDKQGRVLIPPVLREYARLERDVYWVGAMRTLEIWSKPAWQEVVERERAAVSQDILTKLGELGI